MRKICLTVFLIFSASLILSAGPLSGTGILLQTPPGGDDISLPGDPELVKVLPAPALVDPAMLKEPLPGMAWKRQEFYFCYIRIYGGILALKGFGRVYSFTLTNMTTGQSMSVDRGHIKIALRNEDEVFIPVSEDGVYQLSFQTLAGCYESTFTINFAEILQELGDPIFGREHPNFNRF